MRATVERRVSAAHAIIDQAITEFDPSHVFGLFSGGHDSLCASHVASLHPKFSGAIHINTTIGVEETRVFVDETTAFMGWPLKVYEPPASYRQIVLEHGMPGPGAHLYMYTRLKERCIQQLIREHKVKTRDRILLITGVRLQESKRRMGHVEPIRRVKCQVWVAPILDWSAEDKIEHMEAYGLPANPVVKNLCMSGECLCGAFAEPGELEQLRFFYPKAAAVIDALAAEAEARGVHALWGVRPPKKPDPRQMMMCFSCDAKRERREDTSATYAAFREE